jgi:lipoprotein-releasing system permease protein
LNLLFAWRYLKSKKTTNAVNIIAWISIVAIAVGAGALIVVLSVFNGFEDLVKGLYGDFYADIRIAPATGKVINIDSTQTASIKKVNGIYQLSFVAEEKALLSNGDNNQAIVFAKGVDENYTSVNHIANHMIRGSFDAGNAQTPKLILGAGIENATGIDVVRPGLPATMYLPNKKATTLASVNDAFNSYNLHATGTFLVQQEFDNKYVFTNLAFMKFMLDMGPTEFSSIELKVDSTQADKVANQLQQLLGSSYKVETRYQQNKSLYTVMKMEKWIIYGILSLILVVAAFNMIGALTMLVLEKQKDIAVLKAMGANNRTVRNIFLNEGFLLAGIGGLIGIVLASIICGLQLKFHLIKLQGGSFIIDYYPVKLNWLDFLLVASTILFVAVIASWIPARKASVQAFSLKS